jgi:hypothetical protein
VWPIIRPEKAAKGARPERSPVNPSLILLSIRAHEIQVTFLLVDRRGYVGRLAGIKMNPRQILIMISA